MKKVKLLLLDNHGTEAVYTEGTEVSFIVEDMPEEQLEEFFHNMRRLVRPNVRIFEAMAQVVPHFVRHRFHEVGTNPKLSSIS